jgi:protoporphyrinogen oxidase
MHVGVLGGGAAGLTAAMRLAKRGARVTLIEKEEILGGLAAGFQPDENGPYLEKFYHHLFRSDKEIQALIQELGLGDKLEWPHPVTATLYNGEKHFIDSPIAVLKYKPLAFPNRVRMAAALAYLKFEGDYKRLRKNTATEWIQRWMGKQVYEVQWKPLLMQKFGEYYSQISMPWFWSRVHERSIDLGYLRGGFQQLYNRLGEEIEKAGGELKLGTTVTRIAIVDGKPQVHTDKGDTYDFDALVTTLPTKIFLRLAEGLPESYRQKHDWGDALGAHIVMLSLDRPFMEPVYWLNINDPGYPFLVAVEHTNYMPASDYGGRRLMYLGNYLKMDHRYFRQSDEETLAEYLPHLKRLNPDFKEDWITQHWVFKAPFAQPVVTREYEAHIPPLKTPLPNVYMGNMFQVFPQDRGQNYSIKLANRLVDLVKLDDAGKAPAGKAEAPEPEAAQSR